MGNAEWGLGGEQARRLAAYAKTSLAAFEGAGEQGSGGAQVKEVSTAPLHPSASALVEPLSERALDVLRLLAEDRTNQEIAHALYVSVNTVKTHLRNIYGKLGVNARRQAIAQTRTLGLM